MKRKQQFELLESRIVLHGSGLSGHLTLSFVPDGTKVSSEESSLYSAFADVATDAEWKSAIQDSFNKWAIHTNADIGVISDSGDPLGTTGLRQGDERFGDIRVAAVPLDPNVYAITFPSDNVAIGTWAADIVFNTEADWNSVEDIAAVALHEAGHIFGVEHSDNPDSVMYGHGRINKTDLSDEDIAAIQKIYGERSPDHNEGQAGNDSLEFASPIDEQFVHEGLFVGYGDITEVGDVDVFEIGNFAQHGDDFSVLVQSDGLSLLEPSVNFFTAEQELLFSAQAAGGVVQVAPEELLDAAFFSIEAGDSGFGIGRYSFAVASEVDIFEQETFEDFATGEFYGFEGFDVPSFVLDGALPFVDVEDHLINELPGAREIPLFFEGEHAFYQTLGSFSDPVEADVYSVFPLDALAAEGIVDDVIGFPDEDPSFPDGDPNVIIGELHDQLEPLTMTVIVQSLGAAMLNPDVRILDEFGNEIPSRIVVNGNGELIVQAEGIVPVIQYFVEVRESGSAVGNYELEVEFDLPSVELAEYLSGELTEADPQQLETLYVATPQLFHFLLDVEETESGSGKVAVEIVNEQGEVVYSISASPGEIRSAANPLLQPGTYHVRVTLIEPGKLGEVFSYALQGQSVSELLGVLPSDPGSQPDFQCDGVTEEFCYPGGQTSDRPFFWDKFIRDYLNRKEDDKEPSPANEDISWWDWYQQLQRKGSKAKPTARTDTYRVLDGKLHVAKKLGLLKNDASEYSNHMIVTVSKAPRHGTVNVKADGSFTYVPETDFFGTDSFFYQAFDFVNASDPVEVTIHRSAPGDSNNDNQIGFADFLVLTMNFLKSDATWEDGDFSGDGKVDFQDFLLLSQSYGLPASAAARRPDEN